MQVTATSTDDFTYILSLLSTTGKRIQSFLIIILSSLIFQYYYYFYLFKNKKTLQRRNTESISTDLPR